MFQFVNAAPVWPHGQEYAINYRAEFKTTYPRVSQETYLLIATSGTYILTVNGHFCSCGPARAGRNHFRIDAICLDDWLTKEQNIIIVEVCGYNSNSYFLQNQPSFFQSEIVTGGLPAMWTGRDFTVRVNPYALRKVQRYSFQRPAAEAYRVSDPAENDSYYTTSLPGETPESLAPRKMIPRLAPYPAYEVIHAQPLFSGGVRIHAPGTYKMDRSLIDIDESMIGFPFNQLDVCATVECQRLVLSPDEGGIRDILANAYTVFRFPHNASGLVELDITCESDCTIYAAFDELFTDGRVDFLRMDCANAVRFDLCSGRHHLRFFEIYVMQYLQVTCIHGSCTINDVHMIEVKHPPVKHMPHIQNAKLQCIADAALETFRQNAVDILMDCASRERAGWLCDSFFTGRVEHLLTGGNPVEKSFLENLLHEDSYDRLPEGMIPMCYPADFYSGEFLPNWSLWLIIELQDYLTRSGDAVLVEKFRYKITKLLQYFSAYENTDGLLERLPGWVFVEWSRANEFVQDISYPTNMLYSAALTTAGELYNDMSLSAKGAAVAETIRQQSWNGHFFTDNALRRNDTLVNPGNVTETCQYYAFFFNIATPDSHPGLFHTMTEDFHAMAAGSSGKWKHVHPSAPFIGNYLRLDILMRYGMRDKAASDIQGYFLHMAETTGTLWEHANTDASCSHGFASYVLYWLAAME